MSLLKPPTNGVTVRMYRQGHGDCFLIAVPKKNDEVYYILIDCGYKPGSQNEIKDRRNKSIGDFVKHIGKATNFEIDLVVITHEHQDHVNGFWKKKNPYFEDFTIKETWLAWTENPNDELANKLRIRMKDELLNLGAARNKLAGLNINNAITSRIDNLLSLEMGDDFVLGANFKASDISNSTNKQAMKLIKDKAKQNNGIKYLEPGGKALSFDDVDKIKAYVLGPPKDEKLIFNLDPEDGEGFPSNHPVRDFSLNKAIQSDPSARKVMFNSKYILHKNNRFYKTYYGEEESGILLETDTEVSDNASFRKIDKDWLNSSENLALKLNSATNNSSLVLAFELKETGKVLLFAADAQRGNWISWKDVQWKNGRKKVKCKELLSRTVLYKVGHHGSHNATLAGKLNDKYPNLEWMGQGKYKKEFTAMITAVESWALNKNNPPWRHPLPSIKHALVEKSRGKVFQTDEHEIEKPQDISDAEWKRFTDRCTFDQKKMYFDYTILDE